MKPIKLNNQSEDETLVHFLQAYNPPAPLEDNFLEDQLFDSIAETKQKSTAPKKRQNWFLTSTIATTALIILSGNALKNKFLPQAQVVQDLPDLETFMVNSWNGAMAESNHDSDLYFATFESEF